MGPSMSRSSRQLGYLGEPEKADISLARSAAASGERLHMKTVKNGDAQPQGQSRTTIPSMSPCRQRDREQSWERSAITVASQLRLDLARA